MASIAPDNRRARLILDLAEAPFVDAIGAHALYELIRKLPPQGCHGNLVGGRAGHAQALRRMGLVPRDRSVRFARALALAQQRRSAA